MEFGFSEEQKAFKEQVPKFSQKELAPLSEAADWKGEFCWEAWRKMGGLGLLGLTYPEAYGGSGSDVVTTCLAGEAVGQGGAEGGLCLALSIAKLFTSESVTWCSVQALQRSMGGMGLSRAIKSSISAGMPNWGKFGTELRRCSAETLLWISWEKVLSNPKMLLREWETPEIPCPKIADDDCHGREGIGRA